MSCKCCMVQTDLLGVSAGCNCHPTDRRYTLSHADAIHPYGPSSTPPPLNAVWNASDVWANCTRPCCCTCADAAKLIEAEPALMLIGAGPPVAKKQVPIPQTGSNRGQTAHRRRCPGHFTGGAGQWCEPTRLHHDRKVHRCTPGSPRAAWQATPLAINAARRESP